MPSRITKKRSSLNPSPELGYMFMGISYGNKEEWQKADDYYDKVIARFEEDGDRQSVLLIDTYTSKAFALSHLERYEEAHQLCEEDKEINRMKD